MKERRAKSQRLDQYETPQYQDLQRRLAANVRATREARNWTQEEAAHRCGMATRLLQRVEAEDVNITLTSLARLCAGLEVDVVDLFRRRRGRS